MRLGKIGLEGQRSLVVGRRFGRACPGNQDVAQVVVRLGKIRREASACSNRATAWSSLPCFRRMLPRLLCSLEETGLQGHRSLVLRPPLRRACPGPTARCPGCCASRRRRAARRESGDRPRPPRRAGRRDVRARPARPEPLARPQNWALGRTAVIEFCPRSCQ